jgi:predicted DNA-binding transcriptional regulator AlpA
MAHTTTNEQPTDLYITVPEAAAIVNISAPGAYIKARTEWAPFTVKLGGSVRINRAKFLRYLSEREGQVS